MGALAKPVLAPGPLRDLAEALHTLHHQAGRPSLRDLGRETGVSRTTISAVFSQPRAPRWGLLELLVEALGGQVEAFHALWLAATAVENPAAENPDVDVATAQGGGPELLPAQRTSPPLVPTATLQQVPASVAGFVGRAEALAELDRAMRPGQAAVPICVLTGTAGVGKTALAVQWAHRSAARFAGGTLYVDLHGYHPSRPVAAFDVLAEFIRALGAPGSAVPDGPAERAALYRSLLAGRQVLIVLDNARSTEQLHDLIPGTADAAVLVTSRDALTGLVVRYGAVRLPVELLPEPEALGLLRRLIGPRIEAEAGPAAALAASCARLPLALRVAAEFVATRPGESLDALVQELASTPDRLTLLDGGDDYSAVRTVFSWSYEHLPAATARMFRVLALHPGPHLEAGAAAALAGTDLWTARQALDELARGHLVERLPHGRFSMHDLLRAYAAELVDADPGTDARAARARVFDVYCRDAVAATAAAFPQGRPSVQPPTAVPARTAGGGLRWLETERPNLLAVAGASGEHALLLSPVLAQYLDSSSNYDDALHLHDLAGQAAAAAGDRSAQAEALNRLGAIRRRQGDYARAVLDHRRAADLFEAAGDPGGLGQALQNLGVIAWRSGRYLQARDHLERALPLHRAAADRSGEGGALYSLGIVHRRLGEYAEAITCHRQALAVFEEAGDVTGIGRALNNLAVVHLQLGDHDRARQCLEQALTIQRSRSDQAAESAVLTNLGLVHERAGRHAEALSTLESALACAERAGYPVGRADALRGLGVVHGRIGQVEQGERLLREALALGRRLGEGDVQTGALNELGQLLVAAGRAPDAEEYLQEALTRSTEAGDRYEQGRALLGLSQVHTQAGSMLEAERDTARATALMDELGIGRSVPPQG